MAVRVQETRAGYVGNQEAGVVFTEQERIKVERISGKPVWLRDSVYSRVNYYIRMSRDYVPKNKQCWLTRYADLVGLPWVFPIVFIIGMISSAAFFISFIMAAISILFIIIFTQHLCVVITTVPILLSLPHLPDDVMQYSNDFFKVTLEKYHSMFAATQDTAVGVAIESEGTIKIHVLSAQARKNVIFTVLFSVSSWVASIFMLLGCVGIGGLPFWL